ncbi:MAG: LuxR C-terminal-related transcriptional regulator, partial [Desulfobacterales bacterium]
RAARAVLNGELWYSRQILAQFIDEKDAPLAPTKEACVMLTRREREIVTKLAKGCSNREIARHFRISPHTVKTHAYNIYKKINVDSRLKASLRLANSS